MSTIMEGLGVKHRIARVNLFSRIIAEVVSEREPTPSGLTIDEVLEDSAQRCNVIPAQMRSALIFADSEGIVSVDYRNQTVHGTSLALA